jgi:hypothetical protein
MWSVLIKTMNISAPSPAPVGPEDTTFNQDNTMLYYLNRNTDQAYRCIINPITSKVQFCVPTVVPSSLTPYSGLAVTN